MPLEGQVLPRDAARRARRDRHGLHPVVGGRRAGGEDLIAAPGEPAEILAAAASVLVVDWPTRDVAVALARAGLAVVVHGGPGPRDYTSYGVEDGAVVARDLGHPPDRVDLVYSYRPLDELGGIVEMARRTGARAVWVQSGVTATGQEDPRGCWMPPDDRERARALVEGAGLAFVAEPSIVDAAATLPAQASEG